MSIRYTDVKKFIDGNLNFMTLAMDPKDLINMVTKYSHLQNDEKMMERDLEYMTRVCMLGHKC